VLKYEVLNYGRPLNPNVVNPAITSTTQPLPQPPPQPQPHGQYQTLQTHILVPAVTGPPGKMLKASGRERSFSINYRSSWTHLEATPVFAASSARPVAGAASLPSLPPGRFPAMNDKGERICWQCGLPGRYTEGKCVEKWGPGPKGPGTVCDRCRKKIKRVERRGTLDLHSQTSAFVHSRQHAPIQERDRAHGLPAQQGTGRPIGRTDTVVVSHPLLPQQPPQAYGGPPEARERVRDLYSVRVSITRSGLIMCRHR
jgi:hypothetical protein